MQYRVEGIVIRAVAYGEGNLIVTIYTEGSGKIGVMARGAKKTRSRLGAVTQLYTYGEYVFFKSGAGSLGTLQHAEIIDSYPTIRADLRSSSYAAYFAELVDRFLPDDEASSFLFEQLKASLSAINEGKDPQIVSHILEMKLLAASGYAPNLLECAVCGRPLEPERLMFSVSLGGTVCKSCAVKAADSEAMKPNIWKLLRLLQATDARKLGNVSVGKESKTAVKAVIRRWMDAHADIRLKTRNVLDQVEAVYDS